MMTTMFKTYSELIQLKTFEERFKYLQIGGVIGRATFGFDRYLNQVLYKSGDWKITHRDIVVRDNGCDLGLDDYEIFTRIIVHHINPITIQDIEEHSPIIFDHENLISTSLDTHNAIHFGNFNSINKLPPERRKGDTTLW